MKGKVLALLRSQQGEPVSGEDLSHRLGVSRTAVWKHIQTLRDEGYEIISQPGTGYILKGVPDLLLPAELKHALAGNRLVTNIEYYESIPSTNDQAKTLADQGAPEGTLVVAESQTQGKGRLGRQWFSPQDAGIYASLILRPGLRPEQAPGFTILAAVALAQAVWQVTGLRAGIKWPNDLLLEGKKFSGILTEMKGEMDRIHYLVIGTGINVNTDPILFPQEFQTSATSIKAVLGNTISRIDLLVAYLNAFEKLYAIYLEHSLSPIIKAWKEWNVTLGQWVSVDLGTTVFSGRAVDIDKSGALVVQGEHGDTRVFHSGEITLSKR